MERLALLGLHVANDTALVTRLARVLKFVADWHLLIACGTSDGNQSASAAEIGKVTFLQIQMHTHGQLVKVLFAHWIASQ